MAILLNFYISFVCSLFHVEIFKVVKQLTINLCKSQFQEICTLTIGFYHEN